MTQSYFQYLYQLLLNIIGQQEQPLPSTLFDSSWKLETTRSNQSQR